MKSVSPFALCVRILATTLFALSCAQTVSAANKEPVDLVYPYLDSANSRWFYFDSASLPFGMVNLSPDTEIDGAWGSGYRYNETQVKGFSHVHAWQLAGVSVMPVISDAGTSSLKKDYYSGFSHETEIVSPGYHRLILDRYGIEAELTATTRVGFHRYSYPEDKDRKILLNLGGKLGPSEITDGRAERLSAREVIGYIVNGPTMRRPKSTRIYFYLVVDQDIKDWSAWQGRKSIEGFTVEGSDAGVVLSLGSSSDKSKVQMKVALSYVSSDKAKQNLESELPEWNFDGVHQQARAIWNEELGKIKISGGSSDQQRRFYTDLWHALQGRRIVSDIDGEYLDMTGDKPQSRKPAMQDSGEPLNNHYNSDSFWGAQWTIQTLWPLAYPAMVSEFINSFLNYYRDGGLFPRGPSGGNYTYVMVGASSTPFVVSAWQKGIRDFDVQVAYEAVRKNHMPGGIMERAGYEHKPTGGGGLEAYIEKGYVPYLPPLLTFGLHRQGAGQTVEYAYQDWSLSEFAKGLGKQEDAEMFSQRSGNWRNVFDTETGFMRPKNSRGNWQTPFDPYKYDSGFVESNASQGTWYVPHDIAGLAEAMGSCDIAAEKLNAAFEGASELGFTSGTSHSQETHPEYRRIPLNYGNQPSIHTAYIFNELGKPWLTQYWAREVIAAAYSDLSPDVGYNGDEDQGLMGSNAVLMKIGLFQVDGGVSADPIYQISGPIFDTVEIALDSKYYPGNKFLISTINNSSENRYIDRIVLNGEEIQRPYLRHSEIVAGGELQLYMSDQPNKNLVDPVVVENCGAEK